MTSSTTPFDLSRAEAETWLNDYKKSWETRDVDLAVSLCTPDVIYHEKHFGPALNGSDALRAYWQDRVFEHQADIAVDFQIWAVRDDFVIGAWQAKFHWLPTNSIMEIDAAFRVRFSARDAGKLLCCHYEEWMEHREI